MSGKDPEGGGVSKLLSESHVLLITSAHEATTTILWEAMEQAVPVVTVDLFGMADIVQDGVTGVKVPVTTYEETAQKFAEQLDFLIEHPGELKQLALNWRLDSFRYTKDKRAEFYNHLYRQVMDSAQKNSSI